MFGDRTFGLRMKAEIGELRCKHCDRTLDINHVFEDDERDIIVCKYCGYDIDGEGITHPAIRQRVVDAEKRTEDYIKGLWE